MANNPWYTSNGIINAIERKIAFPVSQNTFTSDDVLAFVNDEIKISQIPSILEYHEEYFVYKSVIPLVQNINTYPIPYRAMGSRLRGLFWQDQNGNLFDMTRISPDDQAYFQRNVGANQAVYKYYFEGNNIVLTPDLIVVPTGSLVFQYFIRPNQLVTDDNAATVTAFVQSLVVGTPNPGDSITMTGPPALGPNTIAINPAMLPVPIFYYTNEAATNQNLSQDPNELFPVSQVGPTFGTGGIFGTSATFVAVSGAPANNFQFQIGASPLATATNLTNAINASAVMTASNNSSATITLLTPVNNVMYSSSNTATLTFSATNGLQFDQIPSSITNNSLIDFLQTLPGHSTYAYDVLIPPNGIQGNIVYWNSIVLPTPLSVIPTTLVVGDYICSAGTCIIPQIPTDLHTALAERAAARILAAIGDANGLQVQNAKIQDIERQQGILLDNRSDGNPQKVNCRRSLLKYTKMGVRRRF
jgi:hypothetical protein